MKWHGIMPAITTAFKEDLSVDYSALAQHCRWLTSYGISAIVTPGSLGEGATLSAAEKVEIWRTAAAALVDKKVPVVAAISAMTPQEAMDLAKAAEEAGCRGLMLLPPYVYRGDWPETRDYFAAVLRSTKLPCMLYNNPIAYGTDLLPQHIEELALEHKNLEAVKESSGDVRRITAIKALVGDRLKIFVGLDDLVVEGVRAGAVGWIAGVSGALPEACGELFSAAMAGETSRAEKLYATLLPLLRMDTVPKFVQLIKLMQAELGVGSARVRLPRQELSGQELGDAKKIIQNVLATLAGRHSRGI